MTNLFTYADFINESNKSVENVVETEETILENTNTEETTTEEDNTEKENI